MADPATLALIAVGGTSFLSASQQFSAGNIAKLEAETDAVQIETEAAAREADRKEALARAAFSQFAQTGAAGITFQGSPLAVLEEDIRREERTAEREALTARLGAEASRARGRVVRKQARAQAITGLLEKAALTAVAAGAGGGASAGTPAGTHSPLGFSTGAPSPTFGL